MAFFVSETIETIRQSQICGHQTPFTMTTSRSHLRIQLLSGSWPWTRSIELIMSIEIQIMFLGSNILYQHPQGSTAGVATIHHCDVQQIPHERVNFHKIPEVMRSFSANWNTDSLGWMLTLTFEAISQYPTCKVHVEAYRENGRISSSQPTSNNARHELPKHQSVLPRLESFEKLKQAVLKVISDSPRCSWPGLRGLSSVYQRQWYGRGNSTTVESCISCWSGWRPLSRWPSTACVHGYDLSCHWPIATGFFQRWSILNRLDHYRCTARRVFHWTVAKVSCSEVGRCTTNRQPTWTRCPLLMRDDGQIYIFDKAAAAVDDDDQCTVAVLHWRDRTDG